MKMKMKIQKIENLKKRRKERNPIFIIIIIIYPLTARVVGAPQMIS